MLSDADIPFTYVDIGDLPHMASALETIVGEHTLPVLLVDGKPYKGVERVRKYIKTQ
jgi:glutaredoxin